MKIKLTNISGYHSTVINEDGNSIKVDNKSTDNPQGVSPMELLLMGVAGCSSIDIISILKKQKQNFKDLTIEVEGEREKVGLANLFKKIHAKVEFTGDVNPKKAHKACQLSFTKYCSVSMMMEGKAEISFSAYVNGVKCDTT